MLRLCMARPSVLSGDCRWLMLTVMSIRRSRSATGASWPRWRARRATWPRRHEQLSAQLDQTKVCSAASPSAWSPNTDGGHRDLLQAETCALRSAETCALTSPAKQLTNMLGQAKEPSTKCCLLERTDSTASVHGQQCQCCALRSPRQSSRSGQLV